MARVDETTLDEVFSYHKPDGEQPAQYEAIRAAAKDFSRVILKNSPACADQTVAIRYVRDAVMNANAAIALKGLI